MRLALLCAETPPIADDLLSSKRLWANYLKKKRPDWKIQGFDLTEGDFPTSTSNFDGFILGGVSDAEIGAAQDKEVSALVKRLFAEKKRLIGAGFGHFAIAKALGGKICETPNQVHFGSNEIEVAATAPWIEAKRFWQYVFHQKSVTKLPTNARTLFRNDLIPNAGFAFDHHLFTTHGHPEYTHKHIDLLVSAYEKNAQSPLPPSTIKAARQSLPLSADNGVFSDWIIRFFE